MPLGARECSERPNRCAEYVPRIRYVDKRYPILYGSIPHSYYRITIPIKRSFVLELPTAVDSYFAVPHLFLYFRINFRIKRIKLFTNCKLENKLPFVQVLSLFERLINILLSVLLSFSSHLIERIVYALAFIYGSRDFCYNIYTPVMVYPIMARPKCWRSLIVKWYARGNDVVPGGSGDT